MTSTSELPLVLVTQALPAGWLSKLDGHCRTIVGPADCVGLAPEVEEQLGAADGLFTLLTTRVTEGLLARAPRLRVVSSMSVGVDHIDIPACTRRRIPVGNTPGVLTDATADLAMALLLCAARRLPEAVADARNGLWSTWSPTGWLGADLTGATLGIVGMGQIGQAVARRAHGFGMRLVYTDANRRAIAEESMGALRMPLEELLAASDFVSLHVPLLPETRGMIGESELHRMRTTAILINTARGPVVDMDALHRALSEGWIAAAGLDVTAPEPLPPDHPLFRLKNCLIVPHIGSATWGARKRMAELACENLLAGLEGRPLPQCVNPELYDLK